MSDSLQAKKSLGQHWLHDMPSLQAMCEAADIVPGDMVLEIGPGTGNLTEVLLGAGAHVWALEFDQDAIKPLRERFLKNSQNLTITQGDIRTFDYAKMSKKYKIVANIPYYLSAHLFRALIDAHNKPSIASLLVQKEVAQRICAQPGKLSLVAVLMSIFYTSSLGELVPAFLFEPPPKVDSQILILVKRDEPRIADAALSNFIRLVKAGFSQPRKKLVNNLSESGVEKQDIIQALKNVGHSENTRAQELSVDDWKKICELLHF